MTTTSYPSGQNVYHLQYAFLYATLIAVIVLMPPVITLLVAVTPPASFQGGEAAILVSASLFSLILAGTLIFIAFRMRLVIEPLGIAYAGSGYRVYTRLLEHSRIWKYAAWWGSSGQWLVVRASCEIGLVGCCLSPPNPPQDEPTDEKQYP